MGRSCSHMEEGRSAFKIFKGKPTGGRPSGRQRHRWEDNIRLDLKEIGTSVDWLRIGIIVEAL